MAGGGGNQPGLKGRGRRFSDNLNLVPFIDLFSTIIIFLLSTAVWDQLAGIQANLGAQAGGQDADTPQELVKKVTNQVRITVADAYIETFDDGETRRYAKNGDTTDFTPIDQFVQNVRSKYVDKKDLVLQATDNAVYADLIGVMDRALGQKFSEIVVTGLGEGKK
jgi:biopolymer transport protein ExbD